MSLSPFCFPNISLPCSPPTFPATPEFPSLAPFISPAKDSLPILFFLNIYLSFTLQPKCHFLREGFCTPPPRFGRSLLLYSLITPCIFLDNTFYTQNCWQTFCNSLFNCKICFLKHQILCCCFGHHSCHDLLQAMVHNNSVWIMSGT